jgi:serine/threonine protein kinase
MTPDSQPNGPDSIRSVLASQHPGIAHEIEGAINTLRKLQQIAGQPALGPNGALPAESVAAARADPDASEANIATADGDVAQAPQPVPVLSAGDTFSRYQIVRLLGRGAMGAVYLAYDAHLQRHVALKTPSLGNNAHAIARFWREARAAAQLRSPHICTVHDVGQVAGTHYISMAFIDGQPLSRVIAERRLSDPRAIAALLQKLARGLHKAHQQGIIHRDLKPDNVMVDADGEPIVMDFGLARRQDDDVRLTSPGRLLGTPAYMSPEQVDADPNKITPATDIYSLGVVLYEILTGRLPFQGSLTSILRQIASAEPPRPSVVNPALGEGSVLERICLKMMARSPEDRYPSMAAVAEALDEVFPRERPPEVRPSLLQRLGSGLGKLFRPRARSQPAGPGPQDSRLDKTMRASDQSGSAADNGSHTARAGGALPESLTPTINQPQSQES